MLKNINCSLHSFLPPGGAAVGGGGRSGARVDRPGMRAAWAAPPASPLGVTTEGKTHPRSSPYRRPLPIARIRQILAPNTPPLQRQQQMPPPSCGAADAHGAALLPLTFGCCLESERTRPQH